MTNGLKNESRRGDKTPRPSLGDLAAGVTVALILIPQSLAYAEIAGLPSFHGLYAAALAPIAAAFFASSPYLQTGPVAMTSLLTFGALAAMATPGTGEFVSLAALLAIAVGAARMLIGLFRGGVIAYLMSRAVLTGFTAGAAIIIISTQLPTALGYEAQGSHLFSVAMGTIGNPFMWDPKSVAITAITIFIILGGRKIHPIFPGVLVAVVIGIGFSYATGYQGSVVGAIPSGLPPFELHLPWIELPHLLVPGFIIALVGFAEPAAIARTYAVQDRTRWDPNREFISQGMANLAAGVVSGFPVGGSFSRTSVTRLSGGKTRWAGAITGFTVLAFMPFASVLTNLPRAVLAAIVISAVAKFIDLKALVRMFELSKPQGLVGIGTFVATIALAPRVDIAVVLGIGAAIIVHLWREIPIHIDTETKDTTLVIRPMGVLFFASAPAVEQSFIDILAQHPDTTKVVLDFTRLGRIDFTAAMIIDQIANDAEKAGLVVVIDGVPPHAHRILSRTMPSRVPVK